MSVYDNSAEDIRDIVDQCVQRGVATLVIPVCVKVTPPEVWNPNTNEEESEPKIGSTVSMATHDRVTKEVLRLKEELVLLKEELHQVANQAREAETKLKNKAKILPQELLTAGGDAVTMLCSHAEKLPEGSRDGTRGDREEILGVAGTLMKALDKLRYL